MTKMNDSQKPSTCGHSFWCINNSLPLLTINNSWPYLIYVLAVSRSESEFCYPPAVGEGVIVIPDVDVYTTNATVNLTCSNTGKVLSPEDAVQVCMGENSWDPSSIVVCKSKDLLFVNFSILIHPNGWR